ncbi:MAG TPA: YbaB/EbfC family nucleoid-associated protein [Polyangia bacterium]
MSVPDLKDLIETAQRLQAEVVRVREQLGGKTVQGETGGGLVQCVASGRGEIVSLTIDPAVLGDKKMVEDLVVGAVNVALDRARELAQTELGRVTGGLPLPPGMFGS